MKNQHRIFVALEVKKPVADRLSREEDWIDQQARLLLNWLQPEDLHITLVPPWYADDNEIHEVAEALAGITYGPFPLSIERVTVGPKKDDPCVIWAEVKPEEALTKLKNKIAELLDAKTDDREFRPHITMAWIEDNEKPIIKSLNIDRKINLNYEAEAILLMESVKDGSHRYDILQRIELV